MSFRRLDVIVLFATGAVLLSSCISLPKLDNGSDANTQRLDRTMDANPNNVHAQFTLGKSLLQSGKPDKAAEHFKAAIKLKPEFEEAWDGLGVAQLDQKHYTAAMDVYTDMKSKFPKSAAASEGLANASLGLGKLDDATKHAGDALAIDPKSAQAMRVQGEAAYEQGNYGEALKNWKAAADTDPHMGKELRQTIDDLEQYVKKYGK